MNYSIEINYPLEGLSENEKENKKTDVDKEIRQIAKETNGDFFAFDIDIAFSTSGSEAIGVNYNWIYKNIDDIKKLINKLPLSYKILWIFKNKKKNIDYTIYNTRLPPDIKKFNNDELDIYKMIINRIK